MIDSLPSSIQVRDNKHIASEPVGRHGPERGEQYSRVSQMQVLGSAKLKKRSGFVRITERPNSPPPELLMTTLLQRVPGRNPTNRPWRRTKEPICQSHDLW